MKRFRRYLHRGGVTLIELIVVITVMAILAASVGAGISAIVKSATQNRNKSAVRNYYMLCKGGMNQLNSGASVYSNGTFTANDDIAVLLKHSTGYPPVRLVRLEDNQSADKVRPFASDEEGYYVCIRYADPKKQYPTTSVSADDEGREFFVDAVYLVSDKACYAYSRSGVDVTVYK